MFNDHYQLRVESNRLGFVSRMRPLLTEHVVGYQFSERYFNQNFFSLQCGDYLRGLDGSSLHRADKPARRRY